VNFVQNLPRKDTEHRSTPTLTFLSGSTTLRCAVKGSGYVEDQFAYWVRTVWSAGEKPERIGEVTSGTQSPTLGVGIGLAYVPPPFSKPDTDVGIEIRGKQTPARIVPKPFYRRS